MHFSLHFRHCFALIAILKNFFKGNSEECVRSKNPFIFFVMLSVLSVICCIFYGGAILLMVARVKMSANKSLISFE